MLLAVYTRGMNKLTTLLISLAVASAPCLSAEPDTTQAVALMGSQPAAPVVVNDSTIQKAIEELIRKQQKQYVDIKKKIPNKLDNPVGDAHPLRNRNLILGGAEVTPM